MSIAVDAIRAKLNTRRSISMDEFKTVLFDGRRNRDKNNGMERRFSMSSGVRDSKIKVGMERRFCMEMVESRPRPVKPKPLRSPAMDRADEATKAYAKVEKQWFKEMIADLSAMKWDSDAIEKFFIGAARRLRRKIAEDSQSISGRIERGGGPDNLHILDNMFKFDKKKHPQLWKKDKKKELDTPN